MNKESMINLLRENKISVSFTKVDGTPRDMLCTLDESILPKIENKTDDSRQRNQDLISVWDLEANGWRSFRISSVNSFSVFNS